MAKQEPNKSVAVGDVLAGKYRVEKILGMGGMGIVVAAMHLDLREMRAIKLIRPDARSAQSVERFLREARAVVRLRSEHVPEVYDVGRLESGAPYIVMELLEGQDLSAISKTRGTLPVEEAVLYVTQACHALAEAHAAGIVHRDLKPGNLFLTRRPDGSVCIKVLDFGISKNTQGDRSDPEMTGAKDLVGSPMYMAPEQMRSARKVDARADVWALGAILYKLLTGRPPFHAPTVPEIFALTLGKQVRPPSALRPDIPNELERVILNCLDKHPQNRYPTAAELGAALTPHGPWEGATIEATTQLFSRARRTSVPPAPMPMPIVQEKPEQSCRLPESPSLVQGIETGDPMVGLARSQRIVRSGPIPTWSASRAPSPPRPAWLGLVVLLSISSAFLGASVVLIVARTTGVGTYQAAEMTTRKESQTAPSVVIPIESAEPRMLDIEKSPRVAAAAPPVLCSAPRAVEKLPEPKRASPNSSFDVAARSQPSGQARAPARIPAKPETPYAPRRDPLPYRE